jgi:hypothetical protein
MMLDGVKEELNTNSERSIKLVELLQENGVEERERSIKLVELLQENGVHRKAIMKRRDELIGLKEYQLAWGAQDKKVTDEWEPSE